MESEREVDFAPQGELIRNNRRDRNGLRAAVSILPHTVDAE